MKRTVLTAALALFSTLFSMSLGATTIDDLGWMTGHWRLETDEGITEEVWLAPEGSLMLGVNRTVRQGSRTFFEFLRIEQRGDAIAYVAQPGGRPPVEFPLVSLGHTSVVFENPDHDFPRRIIYRLEQDTLCARVEGKVDGKDESEEWCWASLRR